MKVVPYTTSTGLQIGCHYEEKVLYPMSRDMELLQSALLNKPTLSSGLARFLRRIYG